MFNGPNGRLFGPQSLSSILNTYHLGLPSSSVEESSQASPSVPSSGVEISKKALNGQDPRRGSIISLSKLEMRPRPLKKAFDLGKRLDVDKIRSESRRSSRSQSLELDYRNLRAGQTIDLSGGKEEEKTFSVTLLVNENEKNVIVDMISRAKNIISRKVEKVIGKKPKAGVSNVETLQTVLESWIGREESREREDKAEEEQLIREQELQVTDLARRGLPVPVSFKPTRDLVVEQEEIETEPAARNVSADMEVSRISWDRHPAQPDDPRPFSPTSSHSRVRQSVTPTLSAADNVPCPWGLRPDSELYPPRLRRPSSMYGTEAAAASSRPPSRLQVLSASPVPMIGATPHSRQISVSPLPSSLVAPSANIELTSSVSNDVPNEEGEEKAKAAEEKIGAESTEPYSIPYCRPASFLIPIGGVWRPEDDAGENEIVWGQNSEHKDNNSGGLGVEPVAAVCTLYPPPPLQLFFSLSPCTTFFVSSTY